LVWQKGIDLAIPAVRRIMIESDAQFIALGTGEPDLNEALWRLGEDFKGRVRSVIDFSVATAKRIYAGSDIFLMPSRYEPCGVGQMLAMRYGSLPLVRETGGLADTVTNYDNGDADQGTGFIFSWETTDAVTGTLRWALKTFKENPKAWHRMQRRAMQTDFSWTKSANEYVQLYTQILKGRGT
jgi:starch synthase